MALSVRRLNADTTFLFTFSHKDSNTAIRVLIDPWLAGDSSWLHPSFQHSSHTIPPAVRSLAAIQDDVDVILVSQDKPDHCHKETLLSWPREKRVRVLATPAAAKKIRDWKHFHRVEELAPYNAGDDSTLTTVQDRYMSTELTIANILSKKDLTGLHNAIGFTYGPARHTTELVLPAMHTPPESPTMLRAELPTLRARIKSYSSLRSIARRPRTPIASPPQTPDEHARVSCIYTPHGVAKYLLEPYIQYHLIANRALPLTLLIHSMVQERNPWFMGGVVAAGAPGGLEIVKLLDGKVLHWLSAHDEEKDNRGMSVKLLKTHRYNETDVERLLLQEGYAQVRLASVESGAALSIAG